MGLNNFGSKKDRFKVAFWFADGKLWDHCHVLRLQNSLAIFPVYHERTIRRSYQRRMGLIYMGRHPYLFKESGEHTCLVKKVLQRLEEEDHFEPEKCFFQETIYRIPRYDHQPR